MKVNKDFFNGLPQLSFDKNHHNSNGNLYIFHDLLIFKKYDANFIFPNETERNIDFLIKEKVPNAPLIYEKMYYNGKFIGYIMEYIKDSMTFRQAIGKNIELDKKIQAIFDVYNSLKYLNSKNIFVGDVHSDNFLITNSGKGYAIDLEWIRFLGDENKFIQRYLIRPGEKFNKTNTPSKYTDNLKFMISSLSLLLDVDLEEYIANREHEINMEVILKEVIMPLNNPELTAYFNKIIKYENVEYFDDFLLSTIPEKSTILTFKKSY